MSEIEKALRKIVDVPTLPTTVLRVLQMLEDPECSVTDLARIIANDPPMAAKVLKIANSSFYGFSHTIVTINQAITILGFATLKNALLTMSVFDLFSGTVRSFDLPGLWTHSVGSAFAGKILAQKIRYPNAEKVFTAGLLHDIGKVVIARYLPDAPSRALEVSISHKIKLDAAEIYVIGASHADVGAWLLHRWRLPPSIVESVRLHHHPLQAKEHFDLTALVYLANVLSHHARIGNSGDRDDLTVDGRVFSHFNLKNSDWVEVRDSVAAKNPDIAAFSLPISKAA